MLDNHRYLFLDFGSGMKRREYLYTYGEEDDVCLERVRLEFNGEKPEIIRVPWHLKEHEELHHFLAHECPDVPLYYFYTGDS